MAPSFDLLERLCNLPSVAGFEEIQHLPLDRLRLHVAAPGRLLQRRAGIAERTAFIRGKGEE
jgi:hypothetical protein